MIQEFIEVADAPAHSYERDLSVIVYHANPQVMAASQRINNALTGDLAHQLPPISIKTREKLVDWSDFLKWKRKLVSEKTRGLRYIDRGWQDEKLIFTVIAENNSEENIYIQSAELDGRPYPYSYIRHADLLRGGTLRLKMGPKPSDFGSDPQHRPIEQ